MSYWYKKLNIESLKEDDTIEINSICYTMRNSILRQNKQVSKTQNQTKKAFGFKWGRRETYESDIFNANTLQFLIANYFQGDPKKIETVISKGMRFLDAGCGSGYSAALLFSKYINDVHYLGVEISDAVDIARERFTQANLKGEFIQADILNLPFDEPVFDLIFSEGVLHHTDSTHDAILYLSKLLNPNGKFLFYVYNKKGPIREFSDDYIREIIRDMDDQQAWDALIPLTKLGKTLGELDVTIDVPEDIPYLGIPSGKIDIQRLVYWHIFKAYYRKELTIEEMNHINFDWYRPLNCQRQTPDQLKEWCSEAGLLIEHMGVQQSGITIVAKKAGKNT